MHCIKTCNSSIRSEIKRQSTADFIPKSTEIKFESKTNDVINCTEKLKENYELDGDTYIGLTVASCTSSTDSGVNVSDNEEIPPHVTSTPSLSENLHSYESSTDVRVCYKNISKTDKNIDLDNNLTLVNNNSKITNRKRINTNNINSNNNISSSSQRNSTTLTPTETTTKNNYKSSIQHDDFIHLQQQTASISSIANTSYDGENLVNNMFHCSGSPVVSIRSISSTIISSDSEEDSDVNSDIGGVQENYVIKKLGTQMIYSPSDPRIPRINPTKTILNQKVIPNVNEVVLPPLEAIAAIGDRIGAAQALGPLPSTSAIAQRPHIDRIALNNSSDVTFGDKHFYEGPVTIQQFLIDSRDKCKDNGEDNPSFANENVGACSNTVKESPDPSAEESSKLYEYVMKHKKLIIPAVLTFAALLVIATILSTLKESESKLVFENNEESRDIIPINSTIDSNNNPCGDDSECEGNGTLCVIERDVWRAHPQKSKLDKQFLPLHRVVISHTASEPCMTLKICSERVRVIQEFHVYTLGWDDIAYNFLISSDGRVFVGRGWDYVGAHTKGYNYDSVGISFIGTYIAVAPTKIQQEACLSLLEEGVRLQKLIPDYRLYGARQLGATESPGEMLYTIIKKWKHWSSDIHT